MPCRHLWSTTVLLTRCCASCPTACCRRAADFPSCTRLSRSWSASSCPRCLAPRTHPSCLPTCRCHPLHNRSHWWIAAIALTCWACDPHEEAEKSMQCIAAACRSAWYSRQELHARGHACCSQAATAAEDKASQRQDVSAIQLCLARNLARAQIAGAVA